MQRLKTKYGSGYRVSVLLQQQQQHTSSNPSLPAHTDTSTSGAPQLEAQVQPEGADSAETRLRLLPFGIPSDLAAVIEQHLGQDVLSTGASMQRTANDKLAPTSAAGGQGGDGGAAAAAARYLNIVVPQNQDRQLLSFLNVLHVSGGCEGANAVAHRVDTQLLFQAHLSTTRVYAQGPFPDGLSAHTTSSTTSLYALLSMLSAAEPSGTAGCGGCANRADAPRGGVPARGAGRCQGAEPKHHRGLKHQRLQV